MRDSYRTKAGEVSLMQAGRDDLWRLRFGDLEGTEYGSPEAAAFALSNRTARLPGGYSYADWPTPTSLVDWRSELVDDLPPRDPSADPDDW